MKSLLFHLFLLVCTSIAAQAADPAWWTNRQVLVPTAASSNFSPVNLGQAKWMALQAKNELDVRLASQGGAGIEVNNLINSFTPAVTEHNSKVLNIGQLKAISKPFYDRLLAVGFSTNFHLRSHGYASTWTDNYPWNSVNPVPVSENFVPANIGQLKVIFSFDFTVDYDNDGITDFMETSTYHSLPDNSDTDNDGLQDGAEIIFQSNPTRAEAHLILYGPRQ